MLYRRFITTAKEYNLATVIGGKVPDSGHAIPVAVVGGGDEGRSVVLPGGGREVGGCTGMG